MAKMSLTPKRTAEEFVKAAGENDGDTAVTIDYPWLDSRVRQDVIKSVNLRLDEPTLLKLKWVSEKTRISQQELIRMALVPFLENEINKVE